MVAWMNTSNAYYTPLSVNVCEEFPGSCRNAGYNAAECPLAVRVRCALNAAHVLHCSHMYNTIINSVIHCVSGVIDSKQIDEPDVCITVYMIQVIILSVVRLDMLSTAISSRLGLQYGLYTTRSDII